MAGGELLSTGKLAEATGASPAKLKKILAELGIEPTEMKGKCAMYDPSVAKKVATALKN